MRAELTIVQGHSGPRCGQGRSCSDIPAHNVHWHWGEDKESSSKELGSDMADSRL